MKTAKEGEHKLEGSLWSVGQNDLLLQPDEVFAHLLVLTHQLLLGALKASGSNSCAVNSRACLSRTSFDAPTIRLFPSIYGRSEQSSSDRLQ